MGTDWHSEADRRAGGVAEGERSPAQPPGVPRAWQSASLLAGAVALAVYGMTLLPGVSSFDVAENQTVPRVLGIMHPTGYPLWTLIGFLWSHFPVGSAAFRMNLLSAVLFAGASALATMLATKLGVRPALAASAGLVFAFAGGTWTNAVHAEVQSLHVFLLAALLVAWVDAEQTENRASIVGMCLAAGLGMAHHGMMWIAAIPLLGWFAVRHPGAIRRPRVIVPSLAALVLPALLYLYLPISYALGAPVVNSDPSVGGWLGVIGGGGLRGTMGTLSSLAIWGGKLGDALNGIERSTGLVVVLLAVAGAVVLAHRTLGVLTGFAIVVAAATYAFANGTGEGLRYLVSPVLIVAVLVGVFAERCAAWLAEMAPQRARRYAAAAVICAFAVVPVAALVAGFHSHDRSADHKDESNARSILAALPPRAVVWAYWDVRTSLQYERFVEGLRPDVTILDARSSRAVGSQFAAMPGGLARAVERDPRLAGRPVCYIPVPTVPVAAAGYTLRRLAPVERPWGLSRLAPGWLYRVERSSEGEQPGQAGVGTASDPLHFSWGEFPKARPQPGSDALPSGASFSGVFVLEGVLRREVGDRVMYRVFWRRTGAVHGVWHTFHHFVDSSEKYLFGRDVDPSPGSLGLAGLPLGKSFSYEVAVPATQAAAAIHIGLFSPSEPARRIPCKEGTFATFPLTPRPARTPPRQR